MVKYPLNDLVASPTGAAETTTVIQNVDQAPPASGWYINVHLGSSSQIEQNGQAHRLFPADHLRQHRQVAFNIGPPTPPEWRRRAPHMVSASVATKAGGGKRTASARRSLLHNLSWRSGLVVVRRVEFDLFGPTGGRVLTESAAQRIEDCQALSHQAGGYLAEPVGAVEDCQVCP